MRTAARTDLNQAAITRGLRTAGVWVFPLHRVGNGFPDLLCAYHGRLTLLEVKGPRGTLTPDERQWFERYPNLAHVVRTLDEALVACGVDIVSMTGEAKGEERTCALSAVTPG